MAGTRVGLTKLTASIRRTPAAASRRTSSVRVSGGSVPGSFWSPSRGPTSQTVTRTTTLGYAAVPRVPVLTAAQVAAALDLATAVDAVREAFVRHARGEWTMPSKVYLEAPPDGDFRAMPAAGAGHAVLKRSEEHTSELQSRQY